MSKTKNRCVLCISDLHFPYIHKDWLLFLKAIKKEYPIDRVVLLGDEIDHHAMSFHDSDVDLLSAGDELITARKQIKHLMDLFPIADILESNHGSMAYRKGKSHGIPRHYLRSYNEVLEAPDTWKWHPELVIKLPNGQDCYFHHGRGSNVLKVSQEMSMNVVQGHYHSKFVIDYWSNPNNLYWGMNVGCMIDDNSLAFAYNKNTVKRPIIGHGLIIEGQPKLLPMIKNKQGRWTGFIP